MYLFLLFIIFSICVTLLLYPHRARRLSNIPSTSFLPFLGHWLPGRFTPDYMQQFLYEQTLLHKSTFYFSMPTQPPFVAIHSPANLEYVLKTNFINFPKGQLFKEKFQCILGDGIFNVDGEQWKKQRKIASQIFTMRELRDTMTDVFIKHAKLVVKKLEKVDKDSVEKGKEKGLDIQDLFHRFTFDSICYIAFGVDLHSLTVDSVPFLTAFDTAQRCVDKRFVLPGWKIYSFLNMGYERELKPASKVLDEFALQVVEERKKLTPEQLNRKTDLLSMFMTAAMKEEEEEEKEQREGTKGGTKENEQEDDEEEEAEGPRKRKNSTNKYRKNSTSSSSPTTTPIFTTQYLRDIIMNFIIAGRDTTAQLLTWCTYELCLHPNMQQLVYEEVKAVIEKRNSTSSSEADRNIPTYEDCCNSFPYLQAVLQETLRLHPSVPRELKYAVADCTLPDGIFVPAGTAIVPLIQIMGMKTDIWGEDALQFKPERWLNMKEEVSAFQFAAFQAGPRTCLGKQMAYLEAKIMMSMLLFKYKVEMIEGQIVIPEVSTTLPMRDPFYVRVEKRK